MPPRGPDPNQLYLEMLRRLQVSVPYHDRARMARQIAGAINATLGAHDIQRYEAGNALVVEQLLEDGYAELGQLLIDPQVDETLAFLATRPVADDYVKAQGSGVLAKTADQATALPHISYRVEDVLAAPHLLELANSRFMLGLAQSYLGCVPTLYSVNLMIAHPTQHLSANVQTFHRDHDDFRFVTLFVFLSDVMRDEDGAHAFIKGSQRADKIERRADELSEFDGPAELSSLYAIKNPSLFFEHAFDLDAIARHYLAAGEVRIKGRRGTGFLVDTSGLHKGLPPASGRRAVFWARYGLYPNLAYATLKMTPLPWREIIGNRLPDDPRTRYVNRLLLA